MRLVNITKRIVTIELDPEDCVRLATACRLAAAELGGPSVTHWIGPIYEALALGFASAAMAALASNTLDEYTHAGKGRERATLSDVLASLDHDRQPAS